MNVEPHALPQRSPLLLDRTRSLLLVIDLQEKLLPLIARHQHIAWNAARLLAAAQTLSIPHIVTEQYPERLGATVSLGQFGKVDGALSKRMFSCRECSKDLNPLQREGRRQVVLCGIETHVCVLQTALDLLAAGWQVFVIADAIGSRSELDHAVALSRMTAAGVIACTVESVLFEWCENVARRRIPFHQRTGSAISAVLMHRSGKLHDS